MILTFVTPEKKIVVNQPVDEVILPGFRGELQLLPGHAPMVTTLTTGILKWKASGSLQLNQAVVSWGYCEISPGGISVLADLADLPEEIDLRSGQDRMKAADHKRQTETLSDEEWEKLDREILRIQAQSQVLGQPN
jgi:F-type H+-transporting ATPase subunit epsilon